MAQRLIRKIVGSRATSASRACRMVVALLALTNALLHAQGTQRFGHQVWTTEDGLPQNSVHQVLQTHDGYLWIATEGGLARFDGLTFTTFRHEDQPAFRSDDIASLAEDKGGALWIGTTDGLLRYAAGQFTFVSLGSVPNPATVLALAAADDGSILARTSSGIMRIAGATAAPLQGVPASVESLTTAPDGSVWIAAGNRLLRYANGRVQPRAERPPGSPSIELQIDRRGTPWVRSTLNISAQLASTLHDRRPSSSAGLQGIMSLATTFFPGEDGHLWIGTRRGLFLAGPAGQAPVRVGEIGERSILSISRDREGDLWIGTESDGLHILRRQNVESVAGLGEHLITAFAQTSDGTVWIGTRDAGLRVVGPLGTGSPVKVAVPPQLSAPLASEVILSIAAGNHDDVWVGTLDGLAHIDQGKVDRYSSADGLPDDVIRSLLVDDDGSLWIGTRRGLVHWQGQRGSAFLHVDGIPGDLIGAMLHPGGSAGDRGLWVATLDGLSLLSRSDTAAVVHSYKLVSGSEPSVITSLAEDPSGMLWIGTRSSGLAAITSSGVQALPLGALPRNINSLLADARGFLWIGTPRGVFRASSEDLRGCLTHPDCAPPVARFGYADGMPSEETTAVGHPAALQTRNGSLWFATAKGAAILDPAIMHEIALAPPVVIERFLVDTESKPLSSQPLSLPFGHTSLTFDYAGLSFAAPYRVRYRYLLEGFSRQWTEAGTRRTAFYTNLPPGSYVFRVQAASSDGIWNRAGAELRFTVRPPFYRRLWFYLLVALALASVAYTVYFFRVRRLRSEFDAVLAERNRIAREIHDTLAQNFVGISFQLQIAEQLLAADNPTATREQLRQTQALVQEGLNDARQSIWELRASVAQDSLPTRLARAAERAARKGVSQDVRIGGIYRPVDASIEKEVLRIAQEALANVARHSRATSVSVELRYESDHLQLAVVDNGRGFDPDAVSSADDHFGLQGMRERAGALSATLSVTSAPANGTSVRLSVPLPRSSSRSERRTS